MIDLFSMLKQPFPADKVSWRVGSTTQAKDKGMALAYIDARDVMERLDDVVGPANWQCRYPHANGKTVCEIGLYIKDQWVWKADGAGDTDHEAEKGALSDAFKRAAVRWGIGRYLYDLSSPWVKIDQRGKSYVINEGEFPRLRKLLENDAKANTPEPGPTREPTAAEAYTDAAIAIINQWKSDVVLLKQWWDDETQHRADAGVVNGTAEYADLFNAFKGRGIQLAGDKRKAA